MRATKQVQKILSNYEGENAGVKGNLCRMLMEGKLGGTGKMIILPVDQGFEHGPARTFAANPVGYDPHYHYQLAIDAGLNAYAAPLGMLEAAARSPEMPLAAIIGPSGPAGPQGPAGAGGNNRTSPSRPTTRCYPQSSSQRNGPNRCDPSED